MFDDKIRRMLGNTKKPLPTFTPLKADLKSKNRELKFCTNCEKEVKGKTYYYDYQPYCSVNCVFDDCHTLHGFNKRDITVR